MKRGTGRFLMFFPIASLIGLCGFPTRWFGRFGFLSGFGYVSGRNCFGCRGLVARFCLGLVAWYGLVGDVNAEFNTTDSSNLNTIRLQLEDLDGYVNEIMREGLGINVSGIPQSYIAEIYNTLHGQVTINSMLSTIRRGLGYQLGGSTNDLETDMQTVRQRLQALQMFLSGSDALGSSPAFSFQLSQIQSGSPDGDWDSFSGTNFTDYMAVVTLNQALQNHGAYMIHHDLLEKLGFSEDITLYSMLSDIKSLLGGGSSGGTDLGFPMGLWRITNGSETDFPSSQSGYMSYNSNSLADALAVLSMNQYEMNYGLGLGQYGIARTINRALLGNANYMLGSSSSPWSGVSFRYDSYGDQANFVEGAAPFRLVGKSQTENITNLLDALRVIQEVLTRNTYIMSQNQYAAANIDFETYKAVTNLVDALPAYWGRQSDVADWSEGKMPTVSEEGNIEIELEPAIGSSSAVTADITPVVTNDMEVLTSMFRTNAVSDLSYSDIKDRYTGDLWDFQYSPPTGGAGGGDTIIEFGEGMEFNVGEAYRNFKDNLWDDVSDKIKTMFDYLWLAICCCSAFLIARKAVSGGV